jgi:hypothetical protein
MLKILLKKLIKEIRIESHNKIILQRKKIKKKNNNNKNKQNRQNN